MPNSFILPIDRTLSGATTLGQSGPGSDSNKALTGAIPSDYFVSYPVHSFEESYPSTEMQSVYSAAPADWARWN